MFKNLLVLLLLGSASCMPEAVPTQGTHPAIAATEEKSCRTSDNKEGRCVAFYLCDVKDTNIDDDIGIIDVRQEDADCPSYLDRCCLSPNTIPDIGIVNISDTIKPL